MALNTVTVTWTENDTGEAPLGGSVTFVINEPVFDSADGIDVRPAPKTYFFPAGVGTGTSDPLVANDNTSLQPTGSYYTVTVAIKGQTPYVFSAQINRANGATQTLAYLQANAAVPAAPYSAYLPLPSGTPVAGYVPGVVANGSTATAWQPASGSGTVASVFTRTGAVVAQAGDYTAAQVGAVATTAVGAASGVASLDSGTHVPAAQLPAATTSVQGAVQLDGTATDIKQTGTASAAGVLTKAAAADHIHGDPAPLPADFGWIAWNGDPVGANTTNALATGVIYLHGFPIRQAATLSNILVQISGTPSLTSGQNWAGIYNSSGTLVAVTADMSTLWANAGNKTCPLATPYSAPAGWYYAAFVSNGATPVTFRAWAGISSTLMVNNGLSGASLRIATNGTGTTLPSTITLASNNASNAAPFCVVIS